MRFEMKKISVFCIASVLLLSGCKHDIELNMVGDKIGFATTTNIIEPSIFRDGVDVAIIKSGKGKSEASVSVSLATKEDLDAYNKLHETSYKLAPSGKFETTGLNFNFAASDTRNTIHVKWSQTFFANSAEAGNEYVIGLKITESDIDTDSSRETVFIHPLLSRVSFEAPDLKTVFPSEDDPTAKNSYEARIIIDYPIATADAKVNIAVDNDLIADISALRDQEYFPAPAGLVKLEAQSVTIKAGESYGTFRFTIDQSVLFDNKGKLIETGIKYLVPVKMTTTEPSILGKGENSYGCIIASIADDDTVTPPYGKPAQIIHGPWAVIEGEDNHIGKDPKCTQPDWYGNYNVNKLVDWNFFNGDNAAENGYWGSYFWSDPVFPIEFVFDLGGEYIFESFYKVDAAGFQGQFREFAVYVAREYSGKDTDWKPAAIGRTDYRGWQAFGNGSDINSTLEKFSYVIPMDPTAEGAFKAYTRGRYVKFCILKTENAYPSNSKGGYLSEFYASGWVN